jgi:hypothetical protein
MRALDLPYERYVEINGGELCGICGAEPKPGKRLNRDHDHRSGEPRGLLCFRCNAALRPYMTSEWLLAASAFQEVAEAGGHGALLSYWRGCRCQTCRDAHNEYKRDRAKKRRDAALRDAKPDDIVYFVREGEDGPVKIGMSTARGLPLRLSSLQTGNPTPLRVIGTFNGGPKEERELIDGFEGDRIVGEWFAPTPALLETIDALRDPENPLPD